MSFTDINADHGNCAVEVLGHGMLFCLWSPLPDSSLAGQEHGRDHPISGASGGPPSSYGPVGQQLRNRSTMGWRHAYTHDPAGHMSNSTRRLPTAESELSERQLVDSVTSLLSSVKHVAQLKS